jgi:hypothetical protein
VTLTDQASLVLATLAGLTSRFLMTMAGRTVHVKGTVTLNYSFQGLVFKKRRKDAETSLI